MLGRGEEREWDVIVALSFGAGKKGKPGKSNEKIAGLVAELNSQGRIPMILQGEVADALPVHLGHQAIVISESKLHPGQYLDTYEVLRQAKEMILQRRWKRVMLVCHPAHKPRAVRTFSKLLGPLAELVVLKRILKGIPFDPDSVQPWTRSRWRWWLREIPAMAIYKLRGWI